MRPRFIRLVFVLTAAFLLSSPTLAADAAKRHIFGFSPDGKYFAFEQYGVQDGTGYPYSDIFLIEIETDTWVKGTPARQLIKRGGVDVRKVREMTRVRAQPYLWRLNVGTKGKHIIDDPTAKAEEAARFIAFTIPDEDGFHGLGKVRLRMTEVALPLDSCATIDEPTRGFVLVLEDETGQPIRILEEDTEIPKSRGCPIHYGISDVLVMPRRGAGPALIVIISIYRFGFEGLDRRFIAVGAVFDGNPTAGPRSAPVKAVEDTGEDPTAPAVWKAPAVLLKRDNKER